MAVCKIEGNSDMYGLGIRLGYYFQWYGAILARWMAPSEVKSLAFSINVFVAATFLALIILTLTDVESLEPVETYIVLLLMFGAYLALVPIYFWRLLTACDPYWDPTRYPRVNLGAMSANLSFILLIGVLVFQYWFWFDRVPDLDHRNCQQYGFVFGEVRLNSKASVVLHVLMYFWLGLVCIYILLLKFRAMVGFPDPGAESRRPKRAHVEFLQNLDVWIRIVIALAVTVATELTISWNEIGGVGTLSGVGQTIPFAIGLAAVVRIVYVAMAYERVELPSSRPVSVRDIPPPISVGQMPQPAAMMRPRPKSARNTASTVSRPSRVQRRSGQL